jgi:hypothetical protein
MAAYRADRDPGGMTARYAMIFGPATLVAGSIRLRRAEVGRGGKQLDSRPCCVQGGRYERVETGDELRIRPTPCRKAPSLSQIGPWGNPKCPRARHLVCTGLLIVLALGPHVHARSCKHGIPGPIDDEGRRQCHGRRKWRGRLPAPTNLHGQPVPSRTGPHTQPSRSSPSADHGTCTAPRPVDNT